MTAETAFGNMKSEKITSKSIPYGISNAVLAFCLDLAGAPMATPACINRYTPDILFAIGGGEKDAQGNVTTPSRFAGLSLEDAAKKAFDEQEAGSVHYRFQMTNRLSPLCKAFSHQERTVAKGQTVNTTELVNEIIDKIKTGEVTQDEGIVRLACVIVKTFRSYKDQCFRVVPMVSVNNPGRVTETPVPGGGKIVKAPGFKAWPVNLSDADRKRIKIK